MQISFEGKEAVLQVDQIETDKGPLTIKLLGHKTELSSPVADRFTIEVNGSTWSESSEALYSSVLYSIMREHLAEYIDSFVITGGHT